MPSDVNTLRKSNVLVDTGSLTRIGNELAVAGKGIDAEQVWAARDMVLAMRGAHLPATVTGSEYLDTLIANPNAVRLTPDMEAKRRDVARWMRFRLSDSIWTALGLNLNDVEIRERPNSIEGKPPVPYYYLASWIGLSGTQYPVTLQTASTLDANTPTLVIGHAPSFALQPGKQRDNDEKVAAAIRFLNEAQQAANDA